MDQPLIYVKPTTPNTQQQPVSNTHIQQNIEHSKQYSQPLNRSDSHHEQTTASHRNIQQKEDRRNVPATQHHTQHDIYNPHCNELQIDGSRIIHPRMMVNHTGAYNNNCFDIIL